MLLACEDCGSFEVDEVDADELGDGWRLFECADCGEQCTIYAWPEPEL